MASLNIDPITVLIGTNSSGKSNILDALSFLNRIAQGILVTPALQGDAGLTQMRGGLEWAAQRPGNRFSISTSVRQNKTTEFVYKIECQVNSRQCEIFSERLIRLKYRINAKGKRNPKPSQISLFWTDPVDQVSPSITARLYNSTRGTPRNFSRSGSVLFQLFGQKTLSEIQDGVVETLEAMRGIFILDPIPSHMRGFSPLSDSLASDAGNLAGVLAALPQAEKDKVENILTHYVSHLPERDIKKVYAEPVGKFGSDAMLYCEESYGNLITLVDARGMSDGTLRFLAILTALLTRPSESMLVVEEVDNGLHPSRSKLLLNMLKAEGAERKIDIMVTTHNPALLDEMGTEMIPFITVAHRNGVSGATELTLLEDIKQLPKLLASGPIGRISSRGLIETALRDSEDAA